MILSIFSCAFWPNLNQIMGKSLCQKIKSELRPESGANDGHVEVEIKAVQIEATASKTQ